MPVITRRAPADRFPMRLLLQDNTLRTRVAFHPRIHLFVIRDIVPLKHLSSITPGCELFQAKKLWTNKGIWLVKIYISCIMKISIFKFDYKTKYLDDFLIKSRWRDWPDDTRQPAIRRTVLILAEPSSAICWHPVSER